jgi:hypothetical protein
VALIMLKGKPRLERILEMMRNSVCGARVNAVMRNSVCGARVNAVMRNSVCGARINAVMCNSVCGACTCQCSHAQLNVLQVMFMIVSERGQAC